MQALQISVLLILALIQLCICPSYTCVQALQISVLLGFDMDPFTSQSRDAGTLMSARLDNLQR